MPPSSVPVERESAAVDGRPVAVAAWLRELLVGPLEAAAFWAAVVLPFLHVPLLLSGLESGPQAVAFVLLLVLNVGAVVLGHPHHRD